MNIIEISYNFVYIKFNRISKAKIEQKYDLEELKTK